MVHLSTYAQATSADEVTADAMEKLREKMANRKEQEFVPEDSDVWAGDPGDGTDFITVVDWTESERQLADLPQN